MSISKAHRPIEDTCCPYPLLTHHHAVCNDYVWNTQWRHCNMELFLFIKCACFLLIVLCLSSRSHHRNDYGKNLGIHAGLWLPPAGKTWRVANLQTHPGHSLWVNKTYKANTFFKSLQSCRDPIALSLHVPNLAAGGWPLTALFAPPLIWPLQTSLLFWPTESSARVSVFRSKPQAPFRMMTEREDGLWLDDLTSDHLPWLTLLGTAHEGLKVTSQNLTAPQCIKWLRKQVATRWVSRVNPVRFPFGSFKTLTNQWAFHSVAN